MNEENTKEELVVRACEVQQHAYVPYSKFKVGAALLTTSGKIYTGVNVENASYPLTCCAERSAVYQAVSHGDRAFAAIAVVTNGGGTPCGGCRQVLREFAPNLIVYICNEEGHILRETSITELLPDSFGPEDLEK